MSGIVRIRDMMFTVKNPFRLDQGDVSFDAPDSVKQAFIKAVAGQPHALPADHRPAAPASARRPEDARQEPRAGGARRRGDRHQRRHPRPVRHVARAARARRRGDPARSAVAADHGHHPVGRRRAGAGAAARVAGVPLGPRRARAGDHPEDQGPVPELAEQPERRQPDPRRPRAARRHRPRAQALGGLGRGLRGRALQRRAREHRVAAGDVRADRSRSTR